MMKKYVYVALLLAAALAAAYFVMLTKDRAREPIVVRSNPSYIALSLDELIADADLIVIGTPNSFDPSRWNTADGKLPQGTTIQSITPDKVIFTDAIFGVDRILKGDDTQNVIQIRSLGGVVGEDKMIVSGIAALDIGKTYLLFLGIDTGSTAAINPGHYFVRGGQQGLYEITDGTAASFRDTWKLDDLAAYIETVLQRNAAQATPPP